MKRYITGLGVVSLLSLQACASMPDVEVHYFLPVAEVKVTVTQSLACDPSKQKLFSVSSAAAVPSYASDPARSETIRLKDLDGGFSDADATFNFTEDGRLKSVNANSTGQAEAILKAGIQMATAVVGLAAAAPPPGKHPAKPTPAPACKAIDDWGQGKAVSLVYAATVRFDSTFAPGDLVLSEDPSTLPLYQALAPYLPGGKPIVTVQPAIPNTPTVRGPTTIQDAVPLTLAHTASVKLSVKAPNEISLGSVVIPTQTTYQLPIPKAAAFGSQKFALTLSDAGAITSITYSKGAGATGALNSVSSAATALTPKDAAAQAAELKAQADLIAQQQRLVQCQADHANCK